MKNLLLLLVVVLMVEDIDAQKAINQNYRRFSVDVSAGIPLMHGDIKNKFVGYDVSARLNWNLTSAISIGTEFSIGNVKGAEGDVEYFSNNYMKTLVGGEVYFFNLFRLNQLSNWFQPYAGINVGAIKSNIVDSQIELRFNDWSWAQQMNAGVKFKLTNMMDLNLNVNLLYTGTDKLDNYKPNVYNNNNRDALSTYKVGLTFHIGKKEKASIIWKDERSLVQPSSQFEDSLKLQTQIKLSEYENMLSGYEAKLSNFQKELARLEKQNVQLSAKLESKNTQVVKVTKEVDELEPKRTVVKGEVTVVESNSEEIENPKIEPSTEATIYFEIDSDVLPYSERTKLTKIVSYLYSSPSAKVVARGYTGKSGDAQFNLSLSLIRAKKVKKYFLDLGVDESRIETFGLGENHSLPHSDLGTRIVVVTVE